MSDLIRLSAAELGERLASGDVSSVEATQAHLDRIAAVDGAVMRSSTSTASAHSRPPPASTAGAQRAAARPLAGVPIAIGTCSSPRNALDGRLHILEGWIPPYDATPVRLVREAG